MHTDIRFVYSSMNDDISRNIYMSRLNYSISHDDKHLEELLNVSIRSSKEWRRFRSEVMELNSRNIVLFGIGIWGQMLIS